MGAPHKIRDCAWCGAPFFADRRHKYCSEECAHEAHLAQARANFKRRYETKHEQECERQRRRYRNNPEKEKARTTAWNNAHPERRRENQRNWYHARKKEAVQ